MSGFSCFVVGLFPEDSLTCHGRKNKGGTDNINFGKPTVSQQWASMHNTEDLELVNLNEMQPLLILLITPVLFLIWHFKMSAMKKAHCQRFQLTVKDWPNALL